MWHSTMIVDVSQTIGEEGIDVTAKWGKGNDGGTMVIDILTPQDQMTEHQKDWLAGFQTALKLVGKVSFNQSPDVYKPKADPEEARRRVAASLEGAVTDPDAIKKELRALGFNANVKWSMRRRGLIEISVYGNLDVDQAKELEEFLEKLKASGCNFIGGAVSK